MLRRTFQRSLGKGRPSAVWMVRRSVDVQTETGIVCPSLVCRAGAPATQLYRRHMSPRCSAAGKLQDSNGSVLPSANLQSKGAPSLNAPADVQACPVLTASAGDTLPEHGRQKAVALLPQA